MKIADIQHYIIHPTKAAETSYHNYAKGKNVNKGSTKDILIKTEKTKLRRLSASQKYWNKVLKF